MFSATLSSTLQTILSSNIGSKGVYLRSMTEVVPILQVRGTQILSSPLQGGLPHCPVSPGSADSSAPSCGTWKHVKQRLISLTLAIYHMSLS